MVLSYLWVEKLFQNLLDKECWGILSHTPIHSLLLEFPDWFECVSVSFHVSGKLYIDSVLDKTVLVERD